MNVRSADMRHSMLVIMLAVGAVAGAQVKVETVDFKGWTEAIKVSNPDAELIVVPQVGRVMHYSFRDRNNILWVNEALQGKSFPADARVYRDYGGDTVWIAPDYERASNPDPQVDGQPWKVELLANGVRMTSPTGLLHPAILTREITLAAAGTEVTFINSLQNKGSRRTMGLMQVTQIESPDLIELPLEIAPGLSKGWFGFGKESLESRYQEVRGRALRIKPKDGEGRRFGTAGTSGKISVAKGATRFISESPIRRGMPYPANSAQRAATSAWDAVTRVEHAGYLSSMETNEIVMQTVKWRLER